MIREMDFDVNRKKFLNERLTYGVLKEDDISQCANLSWAPPVLFHKAERRILDSTVLQIGQLE